MPSSDIHKFAVLVRRELRRLGDNPPSLSVMVELFKAMYFASLRHDEAEPIACRIAFIRRSNPDPNPPRRIVADRWNIIRLSSVIALDVSNLVKLSKAADPWASMLAVDVDRNGELVVWGLVDQTVHWNTFVVRESEVGPQIPGMFQAVMTPPRSGGLGGCEPPQRWPGCRSLLI